MEYDPVTGFPLWFPEHLRYRRSIAMRDVPAQPKGRCKWCGGEVKPPRRSWCSEACNQEFMIRFSAQSAAYHVFRRDGHICAACGIDCAWLERERNLIKKTIGWHTYIYSETSRAQWGAYGKSAHLAEIDHIVPVSEGGGCCGLVNYRVLCVRCHAAESGALRRRLNQLKKGTHT